MRVLNRYSISLLAVLGALSATANHSSEDWAQEQQRDQQGQQGWQEQRGEQGQQGWQEQRGGQGQQGWQEQRGEQGQQGRQEQRGEQGQQGWQEQRGEQGQQGRQEQRGEQGQHGWQEQRGEQGQHGWQGQHGEEGQHDDGGVGIVFSQDEHGILNIVEIIENSPAAAASLHAGDRIWAIDGVLVQDLSPEEVALLMGGQVGSSVSIVVCCNGVERVVSLVRECPYHWGR